MPSFSALNKDSSVFKQFIVQGSMFLTLTDDDLFELSSSGVDTLNLRYQFIIKANSHLNLCIAFMHAKSVNLEIDVEVKEDHASFEIVFLYALSNDQKINILTKQKHSGKKTKGALYARGIVKDKALVDHQGLIFIDENGAKTESSLEHKALVLNPTAQVILVPSIEVLNHDVQCFHGAAVGQFQQEHVWYLKSRGFNEKQVYQILVRSFFSEFIEKFDQPQNLPQRLSEKILESLCQKII